MKTKLPHLFTSLSAVALLATPLLADPTESSNNKAGSAAYDVVRDDLRNGDTNFHQQQSGMREVPQEKLDAFQEQLEEAQQAHKFSPEAIDALNRYATKHKGWKNVSALPPGQQKQAAEDKALPPGWQKKLTVGNRIPEQVYAQARRLPEDIRNSYPQPVGTEDILIGNKLYRVSLGEHIILDIHESPNPKVAQVN